MTRLQERSKDRLVQVMRPYEFEPTKWIAEKVHADWHSLLKVVRRHCETQDTSVYYRGPTEIL